MSNFQPCLKRGPIQSLLIDDSELLFRNHWSGIKALISGANSTVMAKEYPHTMKFLYDSVPPLASLILNDRDTRHAFVDCIIEAGKNPKLLDTIKNTHILTPEERRNTTIFEIDPTVDWVKNLPAFASFPEIRTSMFDIMDAIEGTGLGNELKNVATFEEFQALPWVKWTRKLKQPIKNMLSPLIESKEGQALVVSFTNDLLHKDDGIIDQPLIPKSIRNLIQILATPLGKQPLSQTLIDAESHILNEYSSILLNLIYAQPSDNTTSFFNYLDSTLLYVAATVVEHPDLRSNMINSTLHVLAQIPVFATFGMSDFNVFDPLVQTLARKFLTEPQRTNLNTCINILADAKFLSRLPDMEKHQALDEFLQRLTTALPTLVYDKELGTAFFENYEAKMPSMLTNAYLWLQPLWPDNMHDDTVYAFRNYHAAIAQYKASKKLTKEFNHWMYTKVSTSWYPHFRDNSDQLAQILIDGTIGFFLIGMQEQDPTLYAQGLRFVLKDEVASIIYNLRNHLYYVRNKGFDHFVKELKKEIRQSLPNIKKKLLDFQLDDPPLTSSALIKILQGPFVLNVASLLKDSESTKEMSQIIRIVLKLLDLPKVGFAMQTALQRMLESLQMQMNDEAKPLIQADTIFHLLDAIFSDPRGRRLLLEMTKWFSESVIEIPSDSVVGDMLTRLRAPLQEEKMRAHVAYAFEVIGTKGLFAGGRFNFEEVFPFLRIPLADLADDCAAYPLTLVPIARLLGPVLLYDKSIAREIAKAPKWPCLLEGIQNVFSREDDPILTRDIAEMAAAIVKRHPYQVGIFFRGLEKKDLSGVDYKGIINVLLAQRHTTSFAIAFATGPRFFDGIWDILRSGCLHSQEFTKLVPMLPCGFSQMYRYKVIQEFLDPTRSYRVQERSRKVWDNMVLPLRKLLLPPTPSFWNRWLKKHKKPKVLPAPKDVDIKLITSHTGDPGDWNVREVMIAIMVDPMSAGIEKRVAEFVLSPEALAGVRDGVPQNVQKFVDTMSLFLRQPNLLELVREAFVSFLHEKSLQKSAGVILASFTGYSKYVPQPDVREFFGKLGLKILFSLLKAKEQNSVFWGLIGLISNPGFAKTWSRALSPEDMKLVTLAVDMFRNKDFQNAFAKFLNDCGEEGKDLWPQLQDPTDIQYHSRELKLVLNSTLPTFIQETITLEQSKEVWEKVIFERFLFDYDFIWRTVYPLSPPELRKTVKALSWALWIPSLAHKMCHEFESILEGDPVRVISLALMDARALIRYIALQGKKDLKNLISNLLHHHTHPDAEEPPTPPDDDNRNKRIMIPHEVREDGGVEPWMCFWFSQHKDCPEESRQCVPITTPVNIHELKLLDVPGTWINPVFTVFQQPESSSFHQPESSYAVEADDHDNDDRVNSEGEKEIVMLQLEKTQSVKHMRGGQKPLQVASS